MPLSNRYLVHPYHSPHLNVCHTQFVYYISTFYFQITLAILDMLRNTRNFLYTTAKESNKSFLSLGLHSFLYPRRSLLILLIDLYIT